jgi:hypothetical protein
MPPVHGGPNRGETMPLPTGPVTLTSEKDGSLLTALDHQDGAPVALLGSGQADTQTWIVSPNDDGTVTLTSAQADALLLAARSQDPNAPLILSAAPASARWTVIEQEPGITLQLAGTSLATGYSLMKIWPPRLALQDPGAGNSISWIAAPAS